VVFLSFADLAGPGADNTGIALGEDCYDTIVQGMTLKLKNGLKGTPTIFGWILHGGSGATQWLMPMLFKRLFIFHWLKTSKE